MKYVTIPDTDTTERNQMINIAWITKCELWYDRRYKRYEYRTTAIKYKKYKLLFEAIAKINKTEVYEWTAKENSYSKNIYTKLKG